MSDAPTLFETASSAAQHITSGPRYADGTLPKGYITHIIEQCMKAERERCAQIADSAVNPMNGKAKSGMARSIARRIRSEP